MSNQRKSNFGLSFFGMVGLVMATLKLKQNLDDYKQVSTEGEGRDLADPPSYRDEDEESRITLLDTELPAPAGRFKRKRKNCCMCCGVNCSFFCKALGIVVGGMTIWYTYKSILWAVSPAPTGLESMPAFSSSLGCLDAPYIYNSSQTVFSASMGPQKFDHSFDIKGSAVGTFVVTQGAPESEEIKYEMTLRSNDPALLQDVSVRYPDTDDNGAILNSRLRITTPSVASSSPSCMRYEIKMYVPPSLRKLYVASHTPMHLQFDPDTNIELDDLFVTMFAMDTSLSMILPQQSVRASRLALEVYRGWIVGDVAVVNETMITTQRGDGVANVKAYPTAPVNPAVPEPASLRTTTGAGRTDVFYISPKAFKRPMKNIHISSRNADMYFTYREAEFSGRIRLDSRSFTATGVQPFPTSGSNEEPNSGSGEPPKWTHWAGDKYGADTIFIQSRGWTGLYL